jgi:very-short-patch-repair endonuclease
MSLPEVLLWQALRQRPNGLKFRRQFPTNRITTDFACLSHRLIIEVDGEGHGFGDQPRRDVARDTLLRRDGFRVVRVAARNVLKDMDGVLRWIVATCGEVGPLHHDASRRGPPPRAGEDY